MYFLSKVETLMSLGLLEKLAKGTWVSDIFSNKRILGKNGRVVGTLAEADIKAEHLQNAGSARPNVTIKAWYEELVDPKPCKESKGRPRISVWDPPLTFIYARF